MSRIPKFARADLDEDGQALWDRIESARGGVPTSYRHLLASPQAASAVADLGAYLRFGSSVDPRSRELAVLVVNDATGCEFGWTQHVLVATAMGVGAETIAALRAGDIPAGLSAQELLAVRAAREIADRGAATADTVAALVETWGAAGATDFVLAIGYYTMLAQYFLSMDLQTTPDELGHLSMGGDVAAARELSEGGPRMAGR